jgi:methylthioribose-1-phosphate isomerase
MKQGKIKKVFVGADRVASNGDVANKIGTYNLAILAHHHRIPFYVVAPLSSFDPSIPSGEFIPIEIRSSKEITNIKGKEIAPKGIKVENPAFDVTPHYLIKAFVTDKGIFSPSEIGRYL